MSLKDRKFNHHPRSIPASASHRQPEFSARFFPATRQIRHGYLSHVLLAFDSSERRTAFVAALQAVVDRHDILRTTFVGQSLSQPVQVVWRHAPLCVETRHFDARVGPIADQLRAARPTRIALDRAPLLRVVLADDGPRPLLLLLAHHLISDHTTLDVMLDEIVAHTQGDTARLPAPVPFRTFVAQTRSLPEQAHEDFFRALLGHIDTPTAPFGLLNVDGDGSAVAEARCALPDDLARRLRRAVSRVGATPAGLCHLAWALVLARCCNQDTVVFGTVLFGRMQGGQGVERALGLFINTLPLAVGCSTRPVAQALKETQQALLALMRHEHAPLSLAQRCSALPASTPLFSALLNYRHSPANADSSQILDGVELLHAEERTNYPFTLSVDDLGDGFALTAQVDDTLDPQRVVAYMQRTLEALVEALEDAPQAPLSTLDLLPADERRQLLVDWNATEAPLPETCVHRLFEDQVERTPEATAVVFEDQQLTYAELNARANQLAHRLIALGVGPDERVAIALERSPNMIVALLAVLKAGTAYVPLDPHYPAERLAFMLGDSSARVLITTHALQHTQLLPAPHVLCLDTDAAALAGLPTTNPNRSVDPRHLAYVIYTSGSTGKPKGVAGEHRATVNRIAWMQNAYPFAPGEVCAQKTSLSFVDAVCEIFAPLANGVPLVILEPACVEDPRGLISALATHRVTRLVLVPSLLRVVLDNGADLAQTLPALRICVCSGDATHRPGSTIRTDAATHASAQSLRVNRGRRRRELCADHR